MRIKKGDNVKVLVGKDRGKTGKVLAVFGKDARVSVEGVNLYKKHVRPKRQGEKGEVVTLTRPVHNSNVILVCPSCSRNTRIGYRIQGEEKSRYCKKCNTTI